MLERESPEIRMLNPFLVRAEHTLEQNQAILERLRLMGDFWRLD